MKTEKEEATFEKNFDNLSENIEELEDGDLPLKETIEKFEESLKLSKLCQDELNLAQKRVEQIIEKDGKITTKPFKAE